MKIIRYDYDLNPRFPAQKAKRWIVRRHTYHEGLGGDLEMVRDYASKESAKRAAARLNRELEAAR